MTKLAPKGSDIPQTEGVDPVILSAAKNLSERSE